MKAFLYEIREFIQVVLALLIFWPVFYFYVAPHIADFAAVVHMTPSERAELTREVD